MMNFLRDELPVLPYHKAEILNTANVTTNKTGEKGYVTTQKPIKVLHDFEIENARKKLLPEYRNLSSEEAQNDLIDFMLTDPNFKNCECCRYFYPSGNGVGCMIYNNYSRSDIIKNNNCQCCRQFQISLLEINCVVTITKPLSSRTRETAAAFLAEVNRFGRGYAFGTVTIPCRISGCKDTTYIQLVEQARPKVPRLNEVIQSVFHKFNLSYPLLAEESKKIAEAELAEDVNDDLDVDHSGSGTYDE